MLFAIKSFLFPTKMRKSILHSSSDSHCRKELLPLRVSRCNRFSRISNVDASFFIHLIYTNLCHISHCRNEFTSISQRKYHQNTEEEKNVYAHFNRSANIYSSICLHCCTIITANEKYYVEKANTKRNFAEEGGRREKNSIS